MIISAIMSIVVSIAIVVGFLLLIRKAVLYYLNIDDVIEKQDKLYTELQQIKRLLIEKNTEGLPK